MKYIKYFAAGLIAIALIIVSILLIKPKNVYFIDFNNEKYVSTDTKTFSYENKIIKYDKQDNVVTVTTNFDNSKTVFMENEKEFIFDTGTNIFGYKMTGGSSLTREETNYMSKYMAIVIARGPINIDKINAVAQKIINVFLSILISASGLFLAFPKYFDCIKEKRSFYVVFTSFIFIGSTISYFIILLM